MFEELALAWRALWERRGRTIGTMVGIAIAFAALALAVSVGNAFRVSTQSFFTRSFGTNEVYIIGQSFTDADVATISAYIAPYATAVVPVASAPITVELPGGSTAAATLYGAPAQNITSLVPPTMLYSGTDAVAGGLALAGYFIAFDPTTGQQRLYVGTPIVVTYRGRTYTLVTAGIISAGTPGPLDTMTSVVVDINEFRSITGITTYRTIVVVLRNPNYATEIQNLLKAVFPSAEVFAPSSIAETVNQFFTGLELFLGLVSGVSTVITALWLYDTMTISAIQRTREFGILRAIGFRRSQITAMMIYEAAIIALIGIAAGTALLAPLSLIKINFFALAGAQQSSTANAVAGGFRGFGGPTGFGSVSLTPQPAVALMAAAVVFAANILGALVPAIRAGRINLVEALRYE
ncbi:MAG: ABC transporter permease [Thermoproteus sp. AZ2]|uniref:ABC transporter permease n=1 Tax=Thermoproteus sp. AZ2 TaxID=1609232 RepID=A0ACC6V135_9CREN|nr:MAG: peptide ABC transporter permease [Thermoproteus sp. AZ2]